MRRNEVFRGSFLKAEGLHRSDGRYDSLTLTIKGKPEDHEFDDGKTQRVIAFREDERKLGLNQTNWDSIAEISGKDDDDLWDGTRIVIWVDPKVKFGNKYVPAIRVRAPEGQPMPDRSAPPPTASPALLNKAAAWNKILAECGNDKAIATARFMSAFKAVSNGRSDNQFTEKDWADVVAWKHGADMPLDESSIPF